MLFTHFYLVRMASSMCSCNHRIPFSACVNIQLAVGRWWRGLRWSLKTSLRKGFHDLSPTAREVRNFIMFCVCDGCEVYKEEIKLFRKTKAIYCDICSTLTARLFYYFHAHGYCFVSFYCDAIQLNFSWISMFFLTSHFTVEWIKMIIECWFLEGTWYSDNYHHQPLHKFEGCAHGV